MTQSKLIQVGQKCPYRKIFIAVQDPKKVGSKTMDLTPIVGSEECKNCRHSRGILNEKDTYIYCDY